MADDQLPDSWIRGCDQAPPGPDQRAPGLVLPAQSAVSKTPLGRTARPRASILDSSINGSLISCSPVLQKQQQSAGSSSKQRGALRYAFGTRIDNESQPAPAAAGRKASPARLRAAADRSKQPGSPAAATRLPSPQRVRAAAKSAAAAAAPFRSASAPRMSSSSRGDKVQSRFQQHQASAIAAQRSQTPSPPVRKSSSNALAESRHIARLRRSTDEANRLPGSSGTALLSQVASRGSMVSCSLLAGAKASTGSRVAGATGAQRPLSPSLIRTAGAVASSSRGLGPEPDRYCRTTHRTASRAAVPGPEAGPGSTAVPKLALAGLLSRSGAGQAAASRDGSSSGLPGKAAPLATTSPFLGRVSAVAMQQPAVGIGSNSSSVTPVKLLGAGLHALRNSSHAAAGAASAAFSSPAKRQTPVNTRQSQLAAAAADDDWSPPLLSRQHSSSAANGGDLSRECSRQLAGAWDSGSLSQESSLLSVGSGVAVAVRSLALPLDRLEHGQQQHCSPPKLRRGEHSSPKGAAAICSQLLKHKASSVCSSGENTAAAAPGCEAPGSSLPVVTPGAVQPGGTIPTNLVPRLDLTRLNHEAQQQQQHEEEQQQQHSPGQMPEPQPCRPRSVSGGDSQPVSKRGVSAARKASARTSGSRPGPADGSREEATAPQESFYVYESAMPAEETRTYEELRRVLMRSGRDGSRLAASLQGIWGCYQDARRNTEAMAFRGHRLLDQVSNEYCSFKRGTELELQQLQAERDAYREQAETALAIRGVSASALDLTARDKQLQELQQQVLALQTELANTRQALQLAADHHHATEAQHEASKVPLMARTIAESATTSILFQQTLEQQEQLQAQASELRDIKAALLLACETLTKTSDWQDHQGRVRSQLSEDTVEVLEAVIGGVQAWKEESAAADMAPVAAPAVCIEEE